MLSAIGELECCEKLIELGAKLYVKDTGGRNAWGIAHDWHREDVLELSKSMIKMSQFTMSVLFLKEVLRLAERTDIGCATTVEACAARKVETETKYLGAAALRDWREFYGSRGIDLATKDDVKKVKAYVQHLHHLEGCLLGKGASGEKSELLGGEER